MPYIVVENFGGGMDVRRSSAAAPGGTMRLIQNAFVNRGGEIEKRKAWTLIETLTDLFQSSASLPVAGPFPTFDVDAVGFIFDDAVAYPAAAGAWSTNGAGRVLTVDDFRFGIYRMNLTFAVNLTFSAQMYIDESFVSYGLIGAGSRAEHTQFTFTTGDIVPTSHSVIAGRSNLLSVGGTTPHFLLRFDSMIGVRPGVFQIQKSGTGAPEADSGSGFGLIDIRGKGPTVGRPIMIGDYFDQAAIFCEKGVQFWNIDADAANFAFDRAIPGDRLVATRTVINYESGDLVYLATSGIRSLRARDSSNFAVRNDLGSPIDRLVAVANAQGENAVSLSNSAVIPETGQLIVQTAAGLFVYSKFDGVSAWSVYDEETDTADQLFYIMDMCPIGDTLCLRDNTNQVFILGGTDKSDITGAGQYDTSSVEVITHYFGVEQPYTEKVWRSIDLACTGTWEILYSIDPKNEAWVSLGTITGDSHLQGGPQIDVSSPLIAFYFLCASVADSSTGAPPTLSQFAIHYDSTEIKA